MQKGRSERPFWLHDGYDRNQGFPRVFNGSQILHATNLQPDATSAVARQAIPKSRAMMPASTASRQRGGPSRGAFSRQACRAMLPDRGEAIVNEKSRFTPDAGAPGGRSSRRRRRRAHRAELGQNAAQHSDARRQRIAIVFDGLGQQVEECRRLLVGQVEPHSRPYRQKAKASKIVSAEPLSIPINAVRHSSCRVGRRAKYREQPIRAYF
jgi:hypothetical protein